MAGLRSSGIEPKHIFMIAILAVIGVYLWGIFTTSGTGVCTQKDIEKERFDCISVGQPYDKTNFVVPETEELQESTLWIIKLFIVGIAVFVSYLLVMKFVESRPSRRDMVSILVLIVGVYFLWVYIIEPTNLLGATNFSQLTLENIGQKTAQMLGVK